jgi:hypothetical protein
MKKERTELAQRSIFREWNEEEKVLWFNGFLSPKWEGKDAGYFYSPVQIGTT